MSTISRQQFDTLLSEAFDSVNKHSNHELSFPDNDKLERLYVLMNFLLDENEKFNLTAIRTPEGVIYKHIFDSITASLYIPENANIIDVGSGAGFPALPLAIYRPDIKVTALDSTAKKVDYINRATVLTHTNNVSAVFGRAEDIVPQKSDMREAFDCAVARSLASLQVLCEFCLPFVRVGGLLIAMKSGSATHEIDEAQNALARLGADTSVENNSIYCDSIEDSRCLFIISKISSTPREFPRKYSFIKKRPL